jgi:hypothetical protein
MNLKITTTKKIISILMFFILSISFELKAQTKGMIVEPATGAGTEILDPNLDGYVSQTTAGFINDDKIESEIPYVPFTVIGFEPTSDLENAPNCGFTDFVDSGTEDAGLHHYNAINGKWYFRFRMGSISPNAKSYSVLIDTDGLFGNSGPNADPDFTANNPGFEIEIILATKFGVYVYDISNSTPNCDPVISYNGRTHWQKAIAHSEICNPQNFFLDFYVDFADLTAQFGLTPSTPVRMVFMDNTGAKKSSICNVSSRSDVGGISDSDCGSLANCLQQLINNQDFCTLEESVDGLCKAVTPCPGIQAAIDGGASSVSGTSSEVNGTIIRVYKNDTLIGTTTVTGGAWTLDSISPVLAIDDTIRVQAEAPDKVASDLLCNEKVVGGTCTPALVVTGLCTPNKGFEGTGIVGAIVRVYNTNGTLRSATNGTDWDGVNVTVAADGTWIWKCNGQSSCSGGANNCIPNGAYYITQQQAGKCESDPVWACFGSTNSESPTITTSPINSSTTSISGGVPAPGNVENVRIFLYVNGEEVASVLTTAGGNWTFGSLTLNACDTLSFRSQRAALCASAPTNTTVVTNITSVAPVIESSACVATTLSTVSGFAVEDFDSPVQIYVNGVPTGTPTTVNEFGRFVKTGLSIAVGSTVTARVTGTCKLQSADSNPITVFGKSSNAGLTLTTSPIIEGMTSLSGAGVNGDTVFLYIDNYPIYEELEEINLVKAVVSGGTWTATGIYDGALYPQGFVSVAAKTPGGSCISDTAAYRQVQCAPPDDSKGLSDSEALVCEKSFVANIDIEDSEPFIIYQFYNGIEPSGSSVLGNGSSITLISDTIISPTTLTIKALKIPVGTCEAMLNNDVEVSLTFLPEKDKIILVEDSIVEGNRALVEIEDSQTNVIYQLYNMTLDQASGDPLQGDGGTIILESDVITEDTEFKIIATTCECDGDLACETELEETFQMFLKANVLPVKFISFYAQNVENGVQLVWSTASEINSDYFEVERSTNLLTGFERIGFVKAAGYSNVVKYYNFIDKQPNNGYNFYRLKQVDFNTDYEYTKTVYVSSYHVKNASISVFPNPFDSYINIVNNENKALGYLVIRDISGKIIFEQEVREKAWRVDMDEFPQGLYFLNLDYGQTFKIIK